MNDFLKQLGLKFLNYIVFATVLFLFAVGMMSGQFPSPSVIKSQLQNFKEVKDTAMAMVAKSNEAMKKMNDPQAQAEAAAANAAAENQTKELIQAQIEAINFIKNEQANLKLQMSRIEIQNQTLLAIANSQQRIPQQQSIQNFQNTQQVAPTEQPQVNPNQ